MEEQPQPEFVVRPMGLGEVLDTGFNLARRHIRLLATVSAWGVVPGNALAAILGLFMGEVPTQVDSTAGMIAWFTGMGLAAIISGFGYVLASMAVTFACARLIDPTGDSHDLAAGALYRAALGRFWAAIVYGFILTMVAIPLVILFPLGIWIGVRWSMSWVALLIERQGPLSALGRSWGLTRGAWLHTFTVVLVQAIVVGALQSVVSGLFSMVGAGAGVVGGFGVSALFNALGNVVAGVLFMPLSLAISVVFFYELRARNEGFDLAQRARRMLSAR